MSSAENHTFKSNRNNFFRLFSGMMASIVWYVAFIFIDSFSYRRIISATFIAICNWLCWLIVVDVRVLLPLSVDCDNGAVVVEAVTSSSTSEINDGSLWLSLFFGLVPTMVQVYVAWVEIWWVDPTSYYLPPVSNTTGSSTLYLYLVPSQSSMVDVVKMIMGNASYRF